MEKGDQYDDDDVDDGGNFLIRASPRCEEASPPIDTPALRWTNEGMALTKTFDEERFLPPISTHNDCALDLLVESSTPNYDGIPYISTVVFLTVSQVPYTRC